LGVVGEVINPKSWSWYNNVVGKGKVPIVDTYWQTETGGHIALPQPHCHALSGGIGSLKTAPPGSCTAGTYGIDLKILDPISGAELPAGMEGEGVLCVSKPWPGMTAGIMGDKQRFVDTYLKPYPGYYFTGDGGRRDSDGNVWVTGRVDDVINSSGHRIGTAEVESALVGHPAVSQAAVVAFPHDVKGEGICCYVTLNENEKGLGAELTKEMKMSVRKSIGPFATPDLIIEAKTLPMTRSGKIMRRILRKLAAGEGVESLGDTSTLADPSCVGAILEGIARAKGGK